MYEKSKVSVDKEHTSKREGFVYVTSYVMGVPLASVSK